MVLVILDWWTSTDPTAAHSRLVCLFLDGLPIVLHLLGDEAGGFDDWFADEIYRDGNRNLLR